MGNSKARSKKSSLDLSTVSSSALRGELYRREDERRATFTREDLIAPRMWISECVEKMTRRRIFHPSGAVSTMGVRFWLNFVPGYNCFGEVYQFMSELDGVHRGMQIFEARLSQLEIQEYVAIIRGD